MTKENRSSSFVSLFLGNEVRNYIRLLNMFLKSIFPEVEASQSKSAKEHKLRITIRTDLLESSILDTIEFINKKKFRIIGIII